MIFLYAASDTFASRAKVLTDSIKKYHPNDSIYHLKPNDGPMGKYLAGLAKQRLEKALELLETTKEDVCIIGADCELYANIDGILNFAFVERSDDVILTPHVTTPLSDRNYMCQMYSTGHANADFIVFKNCKNSKNMLKWLISVTEDGHKDGAFYEQTWISSLPFLFNSVHILTYLDGFNVAYWNVNEVGINNLIMFQFSGYVKGQPEMMSRHSKHRAATQEIIDFYKAYDQRIDK